MNLPTLHTLKNELLRNGQTIGLSVGITLLLVWISSPGVIFIVAIAAVLVAYFLSDVRERRTNRRNRHAEFDPYDPYGDDGEFGPSDHPGA